MNTVFASNHKGFAEAIHTFFSDIRHRKIFRPTANLCSMLLGTEIFEAQELIHSPSQAIYVELPQGHTVHRCFKALQDCEKNYIGGFLLTERCTENDSYWALLPIPGLRPSLRETIESVPLNASIMHLSWGKDYRFADVLQSCEEDYKDYLQELALFAKFFFNLLLYITSASAVAETFKDTPACTKLLKRAISCPSIKDRTKILRKIEEETSRYGIVLGKDIILDRMAPLQIEAENTPSDRKVRVRHWVIGHWRQQAYGPQRKDRKLVWIRPFLRGPTDAPFKVSRHDVDGTIYERSDLAIN